MFQKWLKITNKESKTFLFHIIYSIIDGFILGISAFNEFILIKDLKASDYQVATLFQFTLIVLLFSIITNEFFIRIKRKKKLILYIGIITRLPLLLFLFFPASDSVNVDNFFIYQVGFLLIFLLYYMANPLLLPAINFLLKNSYSHENFGKLYGYASSISKIILLVSTLSFGILLDYNKYIFTYIYPFVAILSILSIYFLSKIDYEAVNYDETKVGFIASIKQSFSTSIKILITNKPYRDFQIAFMFYGFAWMSTAAVITIFFEKELSLSYSSIAFYKNFSIILAIIILPYFGKLLGKIDPRKFTIYTFSSMLFFLFFMGLTEFVHYNFVIQQFKIYYSLIVSYIFYGIFTATISLLWNIGSAYFCKNNEVTTYQSIHLSLAGLRGIISPFIGILFYNLLGFAGVFGIAIASLLVSVWIMFVSMRRHKL